MATLSQFKAVRATAGVRYAAAVAEFRDAYVDLHALDNVADNGHVMGDAGPRIARTSVDKLPDPFVHPIHAPPGATPDWSGEVIKRTKTYTKAYESPVPDAPTMGAATAGPGRASVSFGPSPSANATADALARSYTVTSSPGGITATGSKSPIVVTGLTAGQSYTFTMVANSGNGDSAVTTASNAVTPT